MIDMVAKKRLTPKLMLQLAAPHTWPASIMPVLVASALAYSYTGSTMPLMSVMLMVICALMQASVNTFNDYFDFVKGADSSDDNVDETDSVLVYNDIDPKSALIYAIALLVCAFLLGIVVILDAGFIPLVIAIIGAIVVVLYSAGKTPISYLPIGEATSGIVMGGLIPLASFYVLASGNLDFAIVVMSLPQIIVIALIMMTNNTCDIEKDIDSKRLTLPVCLGRKRAKDVYRFLLIAMVLIACSVVFLCFSEGSFVIAFMLVATFPIMRLLWDNPLTQASRMAAMGQICNLNIIVGAFYAAALFV